MPTVVAVGCPVAKVAITADAVFAGTVGVPRLRQDSVFARGFAANLLMTPAVAALLTKIQISICTLLYAVAVKAVKI